jgi:hypothetical protein
MLFVGIAVVNVVVVVGFAVIAVIAVADTVVGFGDLWLLLLLLLLLPLMFSLCV